MVGGGGGGALYRNEITGWFFRSGENRSTRRKTFWSRAENQQTQPTYDAKSRNRTRGQCHIGGRRVLLTLRHPCSLLKTETKKLKKIIKKRQRQRTCWLLLDFQYNNRSVAPGPRSPYIFLDVGRKVNTTPVKIVLVIIIFTAALMMIATSSKDDDDGYENVV